jgi:hypothetical protein
MIGSFSTLTAAHIPATQASHKSVRSDTVHAVCHSMEAAINDLHCRTSMGGIHLSIIVIPSNRGAHLQVSRPGHTKSTLYLHHSMTFTIRGLILKPGLSLQRTVVAIPSSISEIRSKAIYVLFSIESR